MYTQEERKKGTALRKLLNHFQLTPQHLREGHVLQNIHSFCIQKNKVTRGEITSGIKKISNSTSCLLAELRLTLWSYNLEPIALCFFSHTMHYVLNSFFLWDQFSNYGFVLLLRNLLRKVMGISSNQRKALFIHLFFLGIYSTDT